MGLKFLDGSGNQFGPAFSGYETPPVVIVKSSTASIRFTTDADNITMGNVNKSAAWKMYFNLKPVTSSTTSTTPTPEPITLVIGGSSV